ncbi:Uncharacterised protein [Mycolicibacterium vanbaalenii]|uniref:ANTAR domain-containing protein n=1 Tax=Mycolicibacterium vanbaalenii TaxID=110539 RepID=A0A5S9MZZ2_MYCVN|nr:ANTAR domain-containing protein [Mycolicibacterium vanbaalenii]CAA0081078.1 Uncharacterised protein [Mycolicibacterium vanbaalenii]
MYATPATGVTARRSIDVAVGIIMGLRRCSEDEAFQEIARVVHQTGVPLKDTANALIFLAKANAAPPAHHAEASRIWGTRLEFPAPSDG